MAKPTGNIPEWNTNDNANQIEPDGNSKLNGIEDGSTWGREHLNWMFKKIGEWIAWVRDDAMDRSQNLNDVENKSTSRDNLGCSNASNLTSGTIPIDRIQDASTSQQGVVQLNDSIGSSSVTQAATPNAVRSVNIAAGNAQTTANAACAKTNNLSDVSNTSTAFDNIKQNATTSSAGVVEKATSFEMTGATVDKFPDCKEVSDHVRGPIVSGFISSNNYYVRDGDLESDGFDVIAAGNAGTTIAVTDVNWSVLGSLPSNAKTARIKCVMTGTTSVHGETSNPSQAHILSLRADKSAAYIDFEEFSLVGQDIQREWPNSNSNPYQSHFTSEATVRLDANNHFTARWNSSFSTNSCKIYLLGFTR